MVRSLTEDLASRLYLITAASTSLTMFYPRHMLQFRVGLFWGGATVAGAFSGLLAYGISFMSGTRGLLGWSWIFVSGYLLKHPY